MLSLRVHSALILLCLLLPFIGLAQGKYELNIVQADSGHGAGDFASLITIDRGFGTPSERAAALEDAIELLRSSGYLAASIDAQDGEALKQTATVYVGQVYSWAQLSAGNVDEEILSKAGFRERLYRKKPLNGDQINRLFGSVLTWCDNNGYPFASVQLDSVVLGEEGISAKLKLDKSLAVNIDSIKISGTAKISLAYLYSYLGIKPGDAYNESIVSRLQARLAELPLVSVAKPPRVLFTEEETTLELYLNHARASLLNGVVGFLPDPVTGEILFSGDVQLKLLNGLGRGELFDFNWKKTQTNTTDFRLTMGYPFVFNTPFGIDGTLFLLRRDTLYSDLKQTLGLKYHLTGGNYLKAFVNNRALTLLSTDQYADAVSLPEFADVQTISYGLGLLAEKLDYRFNPTSGYSIELEAGLGNKEIKVNSALPEVIYDSLELRSVQFSGTANLRGFIPFKTRATVMLGNKSGWLGGDNTFENELFRIGGLKTLRGFDEESIFASLYSISTLEFRYLLEQNSYAYAFTDAAYIEAQSTTSTRVTQALGFGAGISFETRAGVFSINYALGKLPNSPVELAAGKIHFGFINLF